MPAAATRTYSVLQEKNIRGVHARSSFPRCRGGGSLALTGAGAARVFGAKSRGGMGRAGLAALVFMLSWGLSARAAAEEISLLGGWVGMDGQSSASYAWGLEYRERLLSHLDATFGYLNEGHLPDHHRDGAMVQLWADTGSWIDRVAFAVGVGPYVYFDTQDDSTAEGYRNAHGVAAILTGRATFSLSREWFASLELNQILATNLTTRTVMLGAGYRLDSFIEALQRSQSDAVADVPNELGVFGGQTVINDLTSERSTNFGIEYRRRAGRHVEFSSSLLDEATGPDGRHLGVTGEIWLDQDFLDRRLVAGLGLGPYVALSSYHTSDGRTAASVVGLASMTVSWRFTRFLALRAIWHRGFTSDDQDRDIVTLGLAWRF